MKITFLGAAENVTGSRFLIESNGSLNLVDCGLYQERNFLNRNWEDFAVAPSDIKNVFLTHAHLDHCGYLPKLVKLGFKGEIFCTLPTREITQIILLDSAKIQEESAAKPGPKVSAQKQPAIAGRLPEKRHKEIKAYPGYDKKIKPSVEKLKTVKPSVPQANIVPEKEVETKTVELLPAFEEQTEIRRAVLYSEILGKPVAFRQPSEQIFNQ